MKCLCSHVQSWHDGPATRCVVHVCGCRYFRPVPTPDTEPLTCPEPECTRAPGHEGAHRAKHGDVTRTWRKGSVA